MKAPRSKTRFCLPWTLLVLVIVPDMGPRIPIKLAMERLAKPEPPAMAASNVNRELPGAALYERLCSRCHGAFGEGGAQRVLAVAPYRYQRAASLAASGFARVRERGRFAEIVLKGLPGRSMPGFGTLTNQQVEELYTFVNRIK